MVYSSFGEEPRTRRRSLAGGWGKRADGKKGGAGKVRYWRLLTLREGTSPSHSGRGDRKTEVRASCGSREVLGRPTRQAGRGRFGKAKAASGTARRDELFTQCYGA